jgi:Tol biopolymer transport system component
VAARVAEDVYGPITSLYEYEPQGKVSIVLKDFEDYSNGAAYFFDNKIDIWAPALDTPLRGESNWLRNVIAHEFTHIVQVQKTMKGGRTMPFYYLQWLHYEDVRRPDVLYGYPDGIVSYPIPILNNPAWFAEGTAQFQRLGLKYDHWDTHRDMLLRARVLSGHELNLTTMGDLISKTSLEREQVYNQGYAFSTYLADTYGEDVLRKISAQLSSWSNWNMERALHDAVGIPADSVFSNWMNALKTGYADATKDLMPGLTEPRLLESEGFFNHSPRFGPDGDRVVYVSNRGEDYRRFALYIRSAESGEDMVYDLGRYTPVEPEYTCAFGHSLTGAVNEAVSWNADGTKVVFARDVDTDQGHTYADLYQIDVQSKKTTRLTHEARASDPAVGPSGAIAFVSQSDGTTNLKVLTEGAPAVSATTYNDGTQVYSPSWDPSGEWIYFAVGGHTSARDLYRVHPDGSKPTVVLATRDDERDPAVSPDGKWLYFSSDRSGIFNLYRTPLHPESSADTTEQITNVIGGAFSPDVSPSGAVVFELFTGEGFKIAVLDDPTTVEETHYSPPSVVRKNAPADSKFDWQKLNEADDSAVSGFDKIWNSAGAPKKYDDVFTSFAFFPVIRFDMYPNKDRAGIAGPGTGGFQGGTLLRSTKIGMYTASREILDGLSLSGGFLFGPASTKWDGLGDFFAPGRLVKLERDAFLRFDYMKGLPFLHKRWSPQISVELFNIVRNLENGLEIEEFPCTACYPDTTFTDVSYSLWAVDVHARSKLNRASMLELGYSYSPYRVRTEPFFSDEAGFTIPSSSTRYFIGHALTAKLYLESEHPYLNSDVLPEGFRAEVGYEYQPGNLLDRFEVKDGTLVPEYHSFRNHRLMADIRWSRRIGLSSGGAGHGIGLRFRGSTILGGAVDDFFNDYVGGLIGARGYPFYALGGNETMWLQMSYHVPILPNLRRQVMFLHLNKLYARLYADAAAAWSGEWPGSDAVRKDVGAELRLGISSFYLLPTALFVSATYGLDAFDVSLGEGFITPDGDNTVRYGKELLWHFGVLFDFDL